MRRDVAPALAVVTAVVLALLPRASGWAAPLPRVVGQCQTTTITAIGPRLPGVPTSGSAVRYANGGMQVSYDVIAAIHASRRGDRVRLCLVSIPQGCPPGDRRGRIYRATNVRTGHRWTAPDSQHSCGGA
jgi:hypothetical protein